MKHTKHIKRTACLIVAVIFAASSVGAMQTERVSAASKPAKVKSLTLKLNKETRKIQLSWKTAKAAKKKEVYIKTPGNKWKKLKTIKKTRTVYSAGRPGSYSFKVRGIKKTKKGKFSTVKMEARRQLKTRM